MNTADIIAHSLFQEAIGMTRTARHGKNIALSNRCFILQIAGHCGWLLVFWITGGPPAHAFPGPGSAVDVFHGMTNPGKVTIDSIADGIQNGKTIEVRTRAALACAEFGPDAKELVPVLITALDQKDEHVRAAVAQALGSIGASAQAAVPALTRVIAAKGNDEQAVWTTVHAADAIRKIGLPSQAAVAALAYIIARADRRGFGSPSRLAAIALGEFRAQARDAVPVLVAVLNRRTVARDVRREVATALGKVSAAGDKHAIAVLLGAAELGSGAVHVSQDDAANGVGDAVGEACTRIAAALAVWKLSHNRRVVPWLCETLKYKDNDFCLHERAAEALGEIGSDAALAVPALMVMADWHNASSHFALKALGRIGRKAEAAVPLLIGQLNALGEDLTTQAAAEALGQIGHSSPSVLAALTDALKNPHCETRIAAAVAIRKLNGEIEPTVPTLIGCLNVTQFETGMIGAWIHAIRRAVEVRRNAAVALGELGSRAAIAEPELSRLLDDEFITVREAAAHALSLITDDSQEW